jgi:phage host-nuclease inhibitor protein Gam
VVIRVAVLEEVRLIVAEANELVAELRQVHRDREDLEDRLNKRVAKLKAQYGKQIDPLTKREDELLKRLLELILPRYYDLTGGKQTLKLRMTDILVRRNPESVIVSGDPKEIVKAILRVRGGRKLLSFTPSLDKKVIKANPKLATKVPGLSIGRTTSVIFTFARTRGKPLTIDPERYDVRVQLVPTKKEED